MTSDKHPAPRDKQKAFTLLEVLVALAVLAAGATALGYYASAFRRISSAETSRADSAFAAVQYMESLIADPPACADTVMARTEHRSTGEAFLTRILYTPVPGPYPLQWIELRSEHFTFRRLVRCARVSR